MTASERYRSAPKSLQIYLIHRIKDKKGSQSGKTKKQVPNELNEMEENNLSNIEFRVMFKIILNCIKKDIETIKKDSQK